MLRLDGKYVIELDDEHANRVEDRAGVVDDQSWLAVQGL